MIRTGKEKAIVFPIILFLEYIILLLIGYMFELETVNSLYGSFGIAVIFITILMFLNKILKDHKEQVSKTKVPILSAVGVTALHIIYFISGYIVVVLILFLF